MYTFVKIKKATDHIHKYEVELMNTATKKTKTIKFGAYGMNDFITYSAIDKRIAEEKKRNYIKRHKSREDWNKSGIDTAGYWAKHILWNKDTFTKSLNDTIK